MRKYICILLVLATVSTAYAGPHDQLDLKVMGFCAVSSLTTAMQNPQACDGLAEICQLRDVIDGIDHDLSRVFAFVDRVQQVQSLRSGVYPGRRTRPNGPDTIVFVTEPIPALHGGILVLVSASAPARVAIFSLDPTLKGELIYDSFVKPKYFSDGTEASGKPQIEAIGQIAVDKKGSIILSEHTDGTVSGLSRKFKIAYDEHGHPKLQLVKTGANRSRS